MILKRIAAGAGAFVLCAPLAIGQSSQASKPSGSSAEGETARMNERISQLSHEVDELKALVHQLQAQLAPQPAMAPAPPPAALLPGPGGSTASAGVPAATEAAAATGGPAATTAPVAAVAGPSSSAAVAGTPASAGVVADLLHGFTVNGVLDGYYEYNTNDPIGRVNYLRAYDVSSNSFSLNQVGLILESAPDLANGKREGVRIDLQYGQATSTLQGNPANEPRPEVYRNIFQAYGTYVFPLGSGLTVDFGKWESSLGMEGNYTKDQMNYSRSFWYDYLPFYHMGVRAKYAINDQVSVNLWITNGANQTESFNNYRSQLLGLVITPTPQITWTTNFYNGQEHPDVIYLHRPGRDRLCCRTSKALIYCRSRTHRRASSTSSTATPPGRRPSRLRSQPRPTMCVSASMRIRICSTSPAVLCMEAIN